MARRPEGETDAGFVPTLEHMSGVRSQVSSSKLNRLALREHRAYGETGNSVSSGTDVRAQAIFAGLRPAGDPAGWGYEAPGLWGTLRTAAGAERISSEQGRSHDQDEAFARPPATAARRP